MAAGWVVRVCTCGHIDAPYGKFEVQHTLSNLAGAEIQRDPHRCWICMDGPQHLDFRWKHIEQLRRYQSSPEEAL